MHQEISQGDVEIALRDALGRRCLSARDLNKLIVRSSFKRNGDEFFIISRKRIGFEWSRMSASNSNYEVRVAKSASRRSLLSATEKFALESWIALSRHREIGSKVDKEPSWSICANQTTIEIIKNLGLNIDDLTYFYNPSSGPVRQYAVADNGYILGKTNTTRKGSRKLGSSVIDYQNFGLTTGFLSVEKVEITTPEMTIIYRDGNNPSVEIIGSQIPETIINGMIGNKLNLLVSDVFGDSEAIIKDVKYTKDKSKILLKIEDRKKHLEPFLGDQQPDWYQAMLKIRR